MLSNLDKGIKSLEAQGFHIDHKGLSAGGFPISLRSTLTEPDIVSPRSVSKPWSIKAHKLRLQASILNPLHWNLEHRGEARIDLRGPKGQRWLFDVRPLTINSEARLGMNGQVKSIHADIHRPGIQAVIGTLPPIVGLDAAQINIKPQDSDTYYDISLTHIFLEKSILPAWQIALGPKINHLQAVILAKKSTASQTTNHFIGESWEMNWNENIFTGSFDLKQTQQGLDGTIRAQITDLSQIINQFETAGMFTPQQAQSLKLGARLIPVNETGQQDVTFNVRQGYLLLFGQRLYKL